MNSYHRRGSFYYNAGKSEALKIGRVFGRNKSSYSQYNIMFKRRAAWGLNFRNWGKCNHKLASSWADHFPSSTSIVVKLQQKCHMIFRGGTTALRRHIGYHTWRVQKGHRYTLHILWTISAPRCFGLIRGEMASYRSVTTLEKIRTLWIFFFVCSGSRFCKAEKYCFLELEHWMFFFEGEGKVCYNFGSCNTTVISESNLVLFHREQPRRRGGPQTRSHRRGYKILICIMDDLFSSMSSIYGNCGKRIAHKYICVIFSFIEKHNAQ